MKKVLYIAPHLSTGGLPQYLTKKIELLKDVFDIYVIEYEDVTGGTFIVQKDRIQKLIGDKLITIPWGGDKKQILTHIKNINPDVIHFEEIPEYFMDINIANQIYSQDRTYKIFETSHDSSVNTDIKRFLPDKFILVSNYQVGMLSALNIPSEVVEYPIEYKKRPDRTEALTKLGLDPNKFHILHVGLFTPRKNQAEFFEYAKSLTSYNIQFHSVGNMADNFRNYWEPLIADKPDNVILHGEKSNVDDYYSAMDLFLFTSRGTVNDKETMPLVIREAISWNLPTFIYNLPVYENYFDKYSELISYLKFDDFNNNVNMIIDKMFVENNDNNQINKDETVLIISTYPNTRNGITLTTKCIKKAKQYGHKIMLVSHYPVSQELQSLVDYYVFDENNVLTTHDFYARYWQDNNEYTLELNLRSEGNDVYHGPAVYTNYYNGIVLANKLGYKNAICFNFDVILNDDVILTEFLQQLKTKKAIFNTAKANEGNILRTVMFGINTEFFIDNFNKVNNEVEYNSWKTGVGSESNGLENMFYHTLKNKFNDIKLISDDEYFNLLKNCDIDICSRVEYFSVLPLTDHDNYFVAWFNNSNVIDDRNILISVTKNGINIDNFELTIKTRQFWYNGYVFENGDVYVLELIENGVPIKKIVVDNVYMEQKLKNNGFIKVKN